MRSLLLPLIFQRISTLVQRRLLDWFAREGRSFPWRSVERALCRTAGEPIADPYMILVSEVMLQQTQTARVMVKLPEFLLRFPTIESLARASRGDLLRAWQGMGYNSRVLRLQEAAVKIVEEYGGGFPESLAALRSLPGVGSYTASAVACFAFGEQVAVIDVNIQRVYSRLFYKMHTANQRMPERSIEPVAVAIVPDGEAYRWHQATMDLGATICTERNPSCQRCPLTDLCLSAYPSSIELFGRSGGVKGEPEILGEPRRIWRGRVVETLRRNETLRVGALLDELTGVGLFPDLQLRRSLLDVVRKLASEGLLVRIGVVREGEIEEHDTISLPI